MRTLVDGGSQFRQIYLYPAPLGVGIIRESEKGRISQGDAEKGCYSHTSLIQHEYGRTSIGRKSNSYSTST